MGASAALARSEPASPITKNGSNCNGGQLRRPFHRGLRAGAEVAWRLTEQPVARLPAPDPMSVGTAMGVPNHPLVQIPMTNHL